MKIRAAIIAVALAAISVGALCAPEPPSTAVIRNIKASAKEIGGDPARGKYFLNGSARIRTGDDATKTAVDATASKILINLFPTVKAADKTLGKAGGMGAVKDAKMTGPVKIVYTESVKTEKFPNGTPVTTTATADSATYDGATQFAYLVGHVQIVSENGDMLEKPMVMKGDKATVNLKPDLGDEDMRFKVESINGLSTWDTTIKPQSKKVTK